MYVCVCTHARVCSEKAQFRELNKSNDLAFFYFKRDLKLIFLCQRFEFLIKKFVRKINLLFCLHFFTYTI